MQLLLMGAPDLAGPAIHDAEAVISQPKRFGLLAYLAAARPYGFQRRDSLLALFWPELGAEQGRRALRQALHFLRRRLGHDSIISRGVEDVAVSPSSVICDVRAFDHALVERDFERALSLYRGDLLDGFYVSGASPRFEQWLDRERELLRERATAAAWLLAELEEQRGNVVGASHWARRATDLHVTNEHSIQRLIELLGRHGDRAGAMRVYESFARRINREYNVDPAPETRALIAAVRREDSLVAPAPDR